MVNVKSFLCLTKYQTMKTHTLINKTSHHWGVLGEWRV